MEIIISLAALIIAALGVWIMIQQKRLNEKQLKGIRFDKFFKIYLITEDFIYKILGGWITIEECAEYFKQMKEAEFLASPAINDFITMVHTKGLELAQLNFTIDVYQRNTNMLTESSSQEYEELKSKKSNLLETIPSLRNDLRYKFDKLLKQ